MNTVNDMSRVRRRTVFGPGLALLAGAGSLAGLAACGPPVGSGAAKKVETLDFLAKLVQAQGGWEAQTAFVNRFAGVRGVSSTINAFVNDKLAMYAATNLNVPSVYAARPETEFDVAPMPSGRKGDAPVTWAGGFAWTVPKEAHSFPEGEWRGSMDAAVDVVVVGGGIGGLTAALTAQDEGARVVLLEKAARIGGSAAASGGTLWCARDLASWMAVQPGGDVALGRALVDGFHEGIPWIERQGVTLRLIDEAVPYRIPRLVYNMEPDADAGMAQLARRFLERGGAIRTGTALRDVLLSEGDGVRGVRVEGAGANELVDVRAGAVVLATGGFQGSAALRARHMGRWSERMVVRANPDSTGDGLQAALRAGAAPAGAFDRFYGHMLPAPPAIVGLHNFAQVKPDFSETAIFVNRHGARFDDESLGDEVTIHAAIHQPAAAVFLVYDEAIRAAVSRAAAQAATGRLGADRIENIRAAGGEILDTPSIETLSMKMQARWGVSDAGLRDTIAAYNAAARAGTGARLHPPKSGACVALETAPYYAMHLVVGITFTYGGIRTDARAQALTAAGEPIPGLFVAGADAGGVYTRGYTGGLVLGLAFGRLAGRHAARYAARRAVAINSVV